MKLAIMGAMPEEISPILEKIGIYTTTQYAGNQYYEAKYHGIDLVIAYSKIGKVFSALTATIMIEHFKATKLLFSGVAGALNDKLNIGDLIIATKLAQHDLDITAFGHPYGYVPGGSVYIETDTSLIQISKKIAKKMGLHVKEGIIATGDQFIADNIRKKWIKETFKADALEMEGCSVGVVCKALDVDFFILRAISDTADMDANFSFDKFLQSSAKVSAEFIINMVDELGD